MRQGLDHQAQLNPCCSFVLASVCTFPTLRIVGVGMASRGGVILQIFAERRGAVLSSTDNSGVRHCHAAGERPAQIVLETVLDERDTYSSRRTAQVLCPDGPSNYPFRPPFGGALALAYPEPNRTLETVRVWRGPLAATEFQRICFLIHSPTFSQSHPSPPLISSVD
ncbi:uncharacterized protein EI90DRAFT_903834 [Cantharellus anzutake]|uniref:uncharacterized protein n=1 Tax=Cantharellus anzutake TaxID=1750568 RepID=UPI0019033543|nr:uncharacterized protein EI90DRAFT_903834 [Cantharellus anzutake]KAF8331942.1 hypothetical protein EI90DRAFT_903834 [Cantharellus anzutake]